MALLKNSKSTKNDKEFEMATLEDMMMSKAEHDTMEQDIKEGKL